MNSWNHRLVRVEYEDAPDAPDYQIHEVYYDAQGRIEAWSEKPVAPVAESVEGLRRELRRFLAAAAEAPLVLRDGKLMEVAS